MTFHINAIGGTAVDVKVRIGSPFEHKTKINQEQAIDNFKATINSNKKSQSSEKARSNTKKKKSSKKNKL
ncbi:hypothetical protein BGZ92_006002 [Podila epicladia]|nr:hypothetical protein BGZ92_006002 [Podila epicladia]